MQWKSTQKGVWLGIGLIAVVAASFAGTAQAQDPALFYQTVQTTCCQAAEAPLTVTCGTQPHTWTCTGAAIPGGDPIINSTQLVQSGQKYAMYQGTAVCAFRKPICGTVHGSCLPLPQLPVQQLTCQIQTAQGPNCSMDPDTWEPSGDPGC